MKTRFLPVVFVMALILTACGGAATVEAPSAAPAAAQPTAAPAAAPTAATAAEQPTAAAAQAPTAASAANASSDQALTVANENTAPAGVSFSSPTTKAAGISLGNIPSGQCKAIWVRRTPLNSGARNSDGGTVGLSGDTAA